MKSALSLRRLLLLSLISPGIVLADWNQWRGPARDGVAENLDLPERWSDDFTPKVLWESETIPSDHYGGHGSAVVAQGRVFLSVVWHRDEPTTARILTSKILGDLGFRGNSLSDDLLQEMEEARMNLNPRLRGDSLTEWSSDWVDERLTEDESLRYKGWIMSRFKLGKTAIPLSDFGVIEKIVNREFPGAAELEAWVAEQTWADPATGPKVLAAVPNTRVVANDVMIALSLDTGETLWKWETAGHPTGRNSSSTPAAANGKVFGLLSTQAVALDQETGELVWSYPFEKQRGVAWSPLYVDGKVIVHSGVLTALDAGTGELLWQNPHVTLSHSSPSVWNDVLLCNSSNAFVGIDLETGEERWSHAAGGDSTPVVNGDYCVVVSKNEGRSIAAFQLSPEGAREMWATGFLARRYGASPIIKDGYLYHLGSARHLCMDLMTGEEKWSVERQSNLSSPVLAGDKLLVLENNGGFLSAIRATPEKHESLGRFKVGVMGCTTPAFVDHRMVARLSDRVVCLDLREGN